MPILINRCYSETTPESAADGENSDSGFISEDEQCTFRELIDYLENHPNCSCWPVNTSSHTWFKTGYSIDDYETMTERNESLHFSRNNPARNVKYWKKAIEYVFRKGV